MDTLIPQLHTNDDRLAVRVGHRSLSYRELSLECARYMRVLESRGARVGDRIAVWTEPSLETIIALVANAVAGHVSVPIDPKLGERELNHILSDAAPKFGVSSAPHSTGMPLETVSITLGSHRDGEPLGPRPILDVPSLVLYTSGTTGAPKGALITARNIASNLDALAEAWAWTSDDVVVHALPLFHVHGLVLGLVGSLRHGGALHWVPRFSPEDIASTLAEHERVMLFGVPTMYHRLAEAIERDATLAAPLRHARILVSGSAPLPAREHQRILALTGQRVVERYGMTETLINCSTRHDGDRHPGVVGAPLSGIELRLVDDERRPIDAHDDLTIGEIAVQGPNVFAGYLNRDDATREVLDEHGWFYTGDLATRAEDGSIRIVGRRATDLIKCGGFKVGAGEVEAALLEHPKVREAAVIGAPHPDLGERIVAFAVTSDHVSSTELENHVATLLSPHKRPREIHFVSALPRNAMGKVQKKALRASLENP
jgi:malonyl-CoA/methylmalonyl-CoA synthetase